MDQTSIRYICYPRTEPPPPFAADIAAVFIKHEPEIATELLAKGLTSDQVLQVLGEDLTGLGFEVESGKHKSEKIERPVFFGENGQPTLRYEVDAYHAGWRCGLEVEAGRAFLGNAIFRDLIQSLVMVQVDVLAIAVPNAYKYRSGGRVAVSHDYENLVRLADTLYSHSRFRFPFGLIVLGY